MSIKKTAILVLGLFVAGGGHYYFSQHSVAAPLAQIETSSGEETSNPPGTLAGAYLSSHYAQNQNDWEHATALLDRILQQDPDNKELIRQSMILSEGSGDHEQAAARAAELLKDGSKDGLAHLIFATHAIGNGEYKTALDTLKAMPKGDMTDFVVPLLEGWANAGLGKFNPEPLKQSTIHAYHGGLIANFLKQKPDVVFGFAEAILAPSGLTSDEVERAADLMAISGHQKDAVNVYKALQSQRGGSESLNEKIAAAEKKDDISKLVPAFALKSPAQGAAIAILDLARILYQEDSDSSARVFAQMALDLDPQMTESHLLIASSYARSKKIDEALRQYSMIPANHPSYLMSQHSAAELLHEAGRMGEAVAQLNALYEKHRNPDSLIRIGDLYRNQQDFKNALAVYDRVAAFLPNPIPEEYWYLLYARGMTHERLGHWPQAESDLKTALEYQPDHPYIMNYLGYAWADQGVHLDESLKMLQEASAMQPHDGYITDSLGWVHYKIGQYDDAVPHLERAVELLPYDSEINNHLGDAYWKVGRKVEARFQWERARNYSKDQKLSDTLTAKLKKGLEEPQGPQMTGDIKGMPKNN
ncbi:MAG: tetratricopeptide repeat protein [Micavibrio sp.]